MSRKSRTVSAPPAPQAPNLSEVLTEEVITTLNELLGSIGQYNGKLQEEHYEFDSSHRKHVIYSIQGAPDLFVKLIYEQNSYSNLNSYPSSIQFVRKREKTVFVYE